MLNNHLCKDQSIIWQTADKGAGKKKKEKHLCFVASSWAFLWENGTMQLVPSKSVLRGRNNKGPATSLKWSHMTSESVGRRLANAVTCRVKPSLLGGKWAIPPCVHGRKCLTAVQFLYKQWLFLWNSSTVCSFLILFRHQLLDNISDTGLTSLFPLFHRDVWCVSRRIGVCDGHELWSLLLHVRVSAWCVYWRAVARVQGGSWAK